MLASDTDSDHQRVMSGQDEKLQQREQESCIPGVMLRNPEGFGWEVTF